MYLPLAAIVTLMVIAVWSGLSALSRRLGWKQAGHGFAGALGVLIIGALAWRTAERNQDYYSGIAIWTDTVHQRPLNGRAWNNLGYSYYKAGQPDPAVACLRRAIDLLPTHAPTRAMAYDSLGNVRMVQGRYNEAIAELSEAVRLNPNYADAHNDLGVALQQLGDRSQAMVQFRAAIRLQPDHPQAHYNLSVLLDYLAKSDEALVELQTARRLMPERAEIPYRVGLLLSNRGRYAEACANFSEALRLKPDFEQARQYLRFCEEKRHASESR
jgi:tetratricopeptide (TPR) repeat protein